MFRILQFDAQKLSTASSYPYLASIFPPGREYNGLLEPFCLVESYCPLWAFTAIRNQVRHKLKFTLLSSHGNYINFSRILQEAMLWVSAFRQVKLSICISWTCSLGSASMRTKGLLASHTMETYALLHPGIHSGHSHR